MPLLCLAGSELGCVGRVKHRQVKKKMTVFSFSNSTFVQNHGIKNISFCNFPMLLCCVLSNAFTSNNCEGISKKLNPVEDTKVGTLLFMPILLGWDFLFLLYCKIKPTEKCENLLVFLGYAFFVELHRSRKDILLT